MKNLVILFLTLLLSACTPNVWQYDKDTPGAETIEKDAVTVDAGTYFRNPSLYLGKPVYLYLREVQGPTKERVFLSLDERHTFGHSGMLPTAALLNQWLDAGLDPDSQYTITFRVTTTIEIPGTPPAYLSEFDRFIVNTEDGPSADYGRLKMNLTYENSLPQQRVKRPFAKVSKNFEGIALYPEKYSGARVRSVVRINKDELRVFDDKHWVVKHKDISVLLPKSVAHFDITTMPDFFEISFAGLLAPEKGGYRLTVDQIGSLAP